MKMKSILAALVLLGSLASTFAQLIIPSDGTDGAFSPVANVEIDLSQAITGTWSDNNAANVGKGIYDAQKWAIVFKYSSVNIPAGVTVTFTNHPSHAPVVWLVQGSVNIAGTVSVNGKLAFRGQRLSPLMNQDRVGFVAVPMAQQESVLALGQPVALRTVRPELLTRVTADQKFYHSLAGPVLPALVASSVQAAVGLGRS